MKCRIVVDRWNSVQDNAGGVTPVLQNTWVIWAEGEPRSGNYVTSENQVQFSYDYKWRFRYEKSRKIRTNDTITYDSMKMLINSISFQNEGNRKYVIARCSVTETHQS